MYTVGAELVDSIPKLPGLVKNFSKVFRTAGDDILEGALKSGTLSNVETRTWYLEQEAKISSIIDKNLSIEQQAQQAFNFRNQIRTQARDLMSDRVAAEKLFGTKPNMTWDQVVKKYTEQGFTGDALYQEIINAAQRSNPAVNQSLGVFPK